MLCYCEMFNVLTFHASNTVIYSRIPAQSAKKKSLHFSNYIVFTKQLKHLETNNMANWYALNE